MRTDVSVDVGLDASSQDIVLVEEETQALLAWVEAFTETEETLLGRAQKIAIRLGAHYRPDGLTEFGFWIPDLNIEVLQSEHSVYLEVFTPLETVDLRAPEQTIRWRADRISLWLQGEYAWGVIAGLQPGVRDRLGSLYWLRYVDAQEQIHITYDEFAASLPYGVFAPAELYDMASLQRQRQDWRYFQQTGMTTDVPPGVLASQVEPEHRPPRVEAPLSILELHVGTASEAGTFEGLTQIYTTIAQKLRDGVPLTPAEQNYIGYDAVELLPTEPPIEYRGEFGDTSHHFFELVSPENQDVTLTSHEVVVNLRKPNTHNWGYDVPILGSATVNPAQLGSLRPDEFVDFIATLHNFPTGPIQVIYDLVYGHASNQSVDLINPQYFKGPNMYGQDLNHQLPEVRAILLEMQRRKCNMGADGIRIDGGQDFVYFNPLSGRVEHDDVYLLAMSDVVQDIDGNQRLLFTIYEDGRPWPQEGWEESSRYLELIEMMPEAYQWGPLIFAHNTPTLNGFWAQKWNRVSEVMVHGENWITGCANHDTLRRGYQLATDSSINTHLGDTLVDTIKNAYDNPATQLWVYGFSPGLPMDFLNASFRGAWLFFRNTDDLYGVKVMVEESGFLDWQLSAELYERPLTFPRLKSLGFGKFTELYRFTKALTHTMRELEYDLEMVAIACRQCYENDDGFCLNPALEDLYKNNANGFVTQIDVPELKQFAKAFMEDAHDYSKVSHWEDQLNPEQAAFNLSLRQLRKNYPWLRHNLSPSDRFNKISDEAKTLFYGLRTCPDDTTQIAMVTHMGGEPSQVTLGDWLQLDLSEWQILQQTPGLNLSDSPADWRSFELRDSQGVLFAKTNVKANHDNL